MAGDAIAGGDDGDAVPTPEAIVEGALFVGGPDHRPLTAVRIASLMRDVAPEEVVAIIERLNGVYRRDGSALRIESEDGGYRLRIAADLNDVRRSMGGKVREFRLNQPSIEVLSLVAYQPGISAAEVDDRRGRESGPVLNQMVRRGLLSLERVTPEGGGRKVNHYYPTERFLDVFGLESLADLPQVDEQLS